MKNKSLTLNTTLKTALAVAILSLLVTGCTVVTYTGPSGERFSRAALGARTAITSLAVEGTTNGVHRLELRGFQQDSTQALGTVTEAAVRAALTRE